MKFRKPGQILLAVAASAIVGLGLTSCGQSNTIDYLYVTANKNTPDGQIAAYRVDQESGAITQIPDSPYPSGGENPVAEVASPNGQVLFVVNHDDNAIVEFAIGTDAKLYPLMTCNTPGTDPEAIAISPDGRLLFVADTYAPAPNGDPAYSQTNPGPGALVAYALTPNQPNVSYNKNTGDRFTSCTPVANGNQSYWPLGNYPGGVALSPSADYTKSQEQSNTTSSTPNFAGLNVYAVNTGSIVVTTTPPTSGVPVTPPTSGSGSISGFTIGTGGALTEIAGSPFSAGTAPTAIASDPTGRFVYVTDSAQNQVIEYTRQPTNALAPINNGLAATGNFPNGITVDQSAKFVYVTNYTDSTVSTFNINPGSGILTASASLPLKVGSGPICAIVEPALNRFLFTNAFLENKVSSAELNQVTGTLTTDQNSPYNSVGQPTCVAAVPHGNHSQENVIVNPAGND